LGVDGHQLLLLAQLVTFSTPTQRCTFLSIGAALGAAWELRGRSFVRHPVVWCTWPTSASMHSEKIVLHNLFFFCVPRGTQWWNFCRLALRLSGSCRYKLAIRRPTFYRCMMKGCCLAGLWRSRALQMVRTALNTLSLASCLLWE
jgi:hypothetical protein